MSERAVQNFGRPALAAFLLGACTPYVAALLAAALVRLVGAAYAEWRLDAALEIVFVPQWTSYISMLAGALSILLLGGALPNRAYVFLSAFGFLSFEFLYGLLSLLTTAGVAYFDARFWINIIVCSAAFAVLILVPGKLKQ